MTDAVDIETAVCKSCRAQFDYRHISALTEDTRVSVNRLIHIIATNALQGDVLRDSLAVLHQAGFEKLVQRIARRLSVNVDASVSAPPPAAPEPQSTPEPPLPFDPTPDQSRALDAVRRLMKRSGFGVAVIVGFAGVGKSASLMFIAREHGRPIIIAPTGRAAARVRELTGLNAMTIHRWIYKAVEDPRTGAIEYIRRAPEEIEEQIPHSRLVVLDEASMVGPDVWGDILSICREHRLKLVCVGDGFQLPPVQPPNAPSFSVLTPQFAQQLQAERIELTQVLRQAQDSPIIRASMAIRNGGGMAALKELPRIQTNELAQVCPAVFQQGGVSVCHTNALRFRVNAGIRHALGIYDEMPQIGEPLLCRKNVYSVGLMNGETFKFEGWTTEPLQLEQIHDRYKNKKETARFGATKIGETPASLAVEELHGRLECGPKAIEIAGAQWARIENLFAGSNPIPHVHAQWGYAYTAHAAQGGQWPFVLVFLEPSIKLGEEDGRRWLYTAITRSSQMTAIHYGTF